MIHHIYMRYASCASIYTLQFIGSDENYKILERWQAFRQLVLETCLCCVCVLSLESARGTICLSQKIPIRSLLFHCSKGVTGWMKKLGSHFFAAAYGDKDIRLWRDRKIYCTLKVTYCVVLLPERCLGL